MALIKQYIIPESKSNEESISMAKLLDHTRFALSAECNMDSKEIAW